MKTVELKVKDETSGGKILNEIILRLESEIIKVEDIIRARVYHEVELYNSKLPSHFHGLVQPTESEAELNGFRMKNKRKIDPEKQFYIACDAFNRNGYFVLVDDRQATALDEEVLLTPASTVSFIKLTPLVGG
jgi:hypothetical protein